MKKAMISFLLLFAATAMSAQTVKGDMNGDNDLTVTDVTLLVDAIVSDAPLQTISGGGDAYAVDNSLVVGKWKSGTTTFTLNDDGTTNYSGAATYKFRPYQGTLMFYNSFGKPVKTIVLNVVENGYLLAVDYATGTYTAYYDTSDGHEFVDLGLPSGTLWATCNVGASSPEDYGDYFAWGETEGYVSGKTTFDWSTYTLCNGSKSTLTKYCSISSYGNDGFTDTLTELELSDDAAYVNWGSNWRMPTIDQFSELINSNYTTTTWTTQNGVNGRLITSNANGNSIFLPAAGCRYDSSLGSAGSYGHYWSRTLYESNPNYARRLYFDSSGIYANGLNRYYGRSVRPVRLPK